MVACTVRAVCNIGIYSKERAHIASDLNIFSIGNVEDDILIVLAAVCNIIAVDLGLSIVVEAYTSFANNVDKAL